jgi:stage V sporulation protein D (sporulation-specific penicillin-binding protein)
VRELLVGVVERGTGMKAAIPGFTVAGKTGTAQKAGVGGYIRGRYVPNFVGFAPAEDPRIVGVVVIEEPKGKYYSGDVAAPVFARIVSQALDILRVAPQEQRLPATVLASSDARVSYPTGVVPASIREGPGGPAFDSSSALPPDVPGGGLEAGHILRSLGGAGPALRSLGEGGTPDAIGLSARQAMVLFARLRLPVKLEGAGFVVSQVPPPGSPVRPGETHTLQLSEAAPPISRPGRGREETSSPLFGP